MTDSEIQAILVTLVLVACLSCLWLVFIFGRRLQSTAFLRDSLVEGAKQQELRALLRELQDHAIAGPLDPSKPPPDDFGPVAQLWTEHIYVPYQRRFSEPFGHESESESEKTSRLEKLAACRQWEAEERIRYGRLQQEADGEALKRAEKRVPKAMDISLLGGGWAFLLEFSTVIVIIFALVILGILKTLDGREIATILAAIAGYVLGKASTGARGVSVKPSSREPEE